MCQVCGEWFVLLDHKIGCLYSNYKGIALAVVVFSVIAV